MKISIITVSLNAAETIEKTILSVLNQTYEDVEYIIIDGGSKDGTVDVIRKYADRLSYWVSEPDEGIYYAMNKGIQKSSGDIIGIINSDDWYEDNIFERIVTTFETGSCDAVYGNMMVHESNGTKYLFEKRTIDTIWYRMIPHPTLFLKKDCYDKYGLFDTKYKIVADYELALRMYVSSVRFLRIDDTIAHFSMGGLSDVKHTAAVEEMTDIARLYVDKSPEPYMARQIIEKSFQNLMVENKENTVCQEKLLGILGNVDKIVVWGTGKYATKLYNLFNINGIEIDAWIDNDPSKWENEFKNKMIKSPKYLKEYNGLLIIAVSGHYYYELKKQISDINSSINPIFIQDIYKEI